MDTLTGQIIKGYELRDQIGTGGFGVVYKAYQSTVEREVAIKVILPAYANRPEFIRRFENEAQIVARLEHPYIVPLFDFWREPDRALLVMRYYPSSLQDHLQQRGCLALEAIAQLVDQIASALAMAHRNGVIHRDLKPENILLDQEGIGYLADFGIASYLEHEKNLPATPGFTGSLEYTAPELLKGQSPSAQSDIYSLGYVIHRGLSGKAVVSEASANRWVNYHLSEPLPPDVSIPTKVFKVLQKATAKIPKERYPSVLDFAASFRAAIPGQHLIGEKVETALQVPINPYKGLRAFEESDADDFFGREALTRHLIEQLTEAVEFKRFLAVVGPSGSGKSSVVKAGLLPALRHGQIPGSGEWYFAEMTPGGQPFEKLAAVLLGVANSPSPDILAQLQHSRAGLRDVLDTILPPGQELLLVIDQFEEVFILTQTDAEIALFLDSLYTAVTTANRRVRVIITLRADFYDRPLLYGDFAELMRARSEVVVPLSAREFEQAIRKPAQRVGLSVEPQLAAAIISDLRGEPGALPLLQYALTELFERREGNLLTLKDYQASGGVLQALAGRAEELYQEMSGDKKELVRQILLRMVTLGEGIEDTRRQVLFSELSAVVSDRAALREILDTFGKYRLLTFEHDPATREPSVEIAHEALIREWTRLRKWLEESRNDVRIQRLLAAGCQEWINSERQEGFLLTGGRLAQSEEWYTKSTVSLAQNEQEFLQASIAEHNRLAAIEAERQAYERMLEKRARSRLQIMVAILVLGIIGTLMLAVIAFTQREKARSAQSESEYNARRSHDTALLSNSQLSLYRDHNADLAITLALEAHKVGSLPEQEYRALSEAVYTPGTRRVFEGHTDWVYRLDLSRDGKRVLSGSKDKTMRLWDVETGELLRTFPADDPTTTDIVEGHAGDVVDVTFSPDERLAASASFDHTARVWDVETGETLHILEGHNEEWLGVGFSPDGRVLATVADTVRLWDVETGNLLRTFPVDDPNTDAREGHAKEIRSATFTPDGNYLITTGRDPFVLVWDIEKAKMVRQFEHNNIVYIANLSPDGTILTAATHEKDLFLWNFETGEKLLVGKGHTAALYNTLFSPDQSTILTVSQDQSIRLWNPETGAEIRRFIGHGDRVFDAEFLPDGRQFITSSYDGTLRLWDLEVEESLRTLEGHEDTVYSVVFSPDGKRLVSAGSDQTVRLWDVQTGKLLRTFGPDDPETTNVTEGHSVRVLDVAFSPDETRLLSASFDNTLRLWDVETGEMLRVFGPDNADTAAIEGHALYGTSQNQQGVWAVAFSPDGKTAYSGGFDNTVIRWDVETGEIIHIYTGHEWAVFDIELTHDGDRFLTASWDKTIKLWDVETGRVIRTCTGHTDWVWDVALSPDEKTFLSAGADKILILWDLETGQEIRRFVGHDDGALSVVFNREGNLAISGGRENYAILWDIQTGELLRRYVGHTDWIRGIGYSPTDDVFATASGDATIRLWPVQAFDQLVEWTKQNRYVRELTCPERKLYRVEPYCDEP